MLGCSCSCVGAIAIRHRRLVSAASDLFCFYVVALSVRSKRVLRPEVVGSELASLECRFLGSHTTTTTSTTLLLIWWHLAQRIAAPLACGCEVSAKVGAALGLACGLSRTVQFSTGLNFVPSG